jgi:hypothetical protein
MSSSRSRFSMLRRLSGGDRQAWYPLVDTPSTRQIILTGPVRAFRIVSVEE